MSIYRYKLKDITSKEKQRVMSGVLLYSYKWSYSRSNYDFPASHVLKEEGSSMIDFENKDRSRKIDRIRAVHADVPEPITLKDDVSKKEELVLEEIDEPAITSVEESVNYRTLNKIDLLEYLRKRNFTFKELKGKTKKSLLKMAEIDEGIDED